MLITRWPNCQLCSTPVPPRLTRQVPRAKFTAVADVITAVRPAARIGHDGRDPFNQRSEVILASQLINSPFRVPPRNPPICGIVHAPPPPTSIAGSRPGQITCHLFRHLCTCVHERALRPCLDREHSSLLGRQAGYGPGYLTHQRGRWGFGLRWLASRRGSALVMWCSKASR